MRCDPYVAASLKVAYCHRVVVHAQAYRREPQPWLGRVTKDELAPVLAPYGLHLLALGADETDLICQLSLPPQESVAAAASKCKGRLSKWLRTELGLGSPSQLLGKGYLAYAVGDTTSDAVTGYLEKQGDHHGYLRRPLPPVLVETSPQDDMAHLEAAHSVSLLRYHLVFGTAYRKGIFTQTEARGVLAAWHDLEEQGRFSLLKASFVPDHVRLAVQTHPAVKPLALAVELMNTAQAVMFERFPEIIIRYGSNRLWENGCYIGSFGDVTSRVVQNAIRRWQRGEMSCAECLPEKPAHGGRRQRKPGACREGEPPVPEATGLWPGIGVTLPQARGLPGRGATRPRGHGLGPWWIDSAAPVRQRRAGLGRYTDPEPTRSTAPVRQRRAGLGRYTDPEPTRSTARLRRK